MKVLGYNAQAAIRHFAENLISRGVGRYQNHSSYRNGHAFLRPIDQGIPGLYVIYKRDFYMTFKHEFSSFCEKYPDLAGEGESINSDALDRALRFGAQYIVFIHPGEVLVAYPMLIKKFCESHGLIRGQKRLNMYLAVGGDYEEKSEVTYSFPKKLLRPFEEEFGGRK